MTSVITVHVWRLLPLATIILLAGLTSIPQDIHDAAAVDGAGFWRHLFEITIPLVMPIMLVAVLFGVIFAFTDMIVRPRSSPVGPSSPASTAATWPRGPPSLSSSSRSSRRAPSSYFVLLDGRR
jgi:multiple sugar transport system permease protein